MALGAQLEDIARLIYRGVLLPSAIGLLVGAGATVWLARLLKSLIYGVSAGDPRTQVLAGVALLGVSVLAATGPALRAALQDPAEVLHRD